MINDYFDDVILNDVISNCFVLMGLGRESPRVDQVRRFPIVLGKCISRVGRVERFRCLTGDVIPRVVLVDVFHMLAR